MKQFCLISFFCLTLTACTLTESQKMDPAAQQAFWNQHQQQIEKITQYTAIGSFAYLSDKQKISAHFYWQQFSPQHYQLRLTTPFGSTILELNSQPNFAQLTDNKGKSHTDSNTENLIYRLTNMEIPLAILQQWMRGLPGKTQNIQLNNEAMLKLATSQQQDSEWQLDIKEYDNKIRPSLPRRLELIRKDEIIKLKIDRWRL